MRRLVVGDIHGAYRALLQVFDRSNFDYDNDKLFVIGDVVDGWPETKQCIDELLKIKNLTLILGNHDIWTWDWMEDGKSPAIWLNQGGKETIQSYNLLWHAEHIKPDVPSAHLDFFKKGLPYYVTDDNKLFVHGGFDTSKPLDKHLLSELTWDRELYETAKQLHETNDSHKITAYDEVFIGHTSTEKHSLEPVRYCEVWNVDQGTGWGGVLSIMDIDSKEFWTSDKVKTLYENCGE